MLTAVVKVELDALWETMCVDCCAGPLPSTSWWDQDDDNDGGDGDGDGGSLWGDVSGFFSDD